ncbi:nucleoside triphosphate pyrophosphohydrolase [Lactobacillus gasseri]|uniref:Phosphoribosyl-ATP pyrophosphohydrolase n=1 Tax=Lactobacillus gasseri TaxID=1596 RepID=A0AB33C766_LACGS|nr:phosphoribosyl-ATP pyrophosphohydrolase [Lactobacillus gasseri]QTP21499.1 nucleoside triphosphate pyrophosphohydrolase [Lactobacillus gasseri]
MKQLNQKCSIYYCNLRSYRQLKPDEREDALKNKIVEEANEVKAAPDDQNLLEELADVYTVLEAFLDFKNISKEDLLKQVEAKKAEKGGFTKFLLMDTDK